MKWLWRIGAVLGWIMLLGVVGVGWGEVAKTQEGVVEFADGYTVKWQPITGRFQLVKSGEVVEHFVLAKRPLAVWYRPSTGSMAIVAAENGSVTDNHLLYVWKGRELRKIYHAVIGYDQEKQAEMNSWLYPLDSRSETENYVNLTPNEEYLLARETSGPGHGYTPRVFRVKMNGLIAREWLNWDLDSVYWSPGGRCAVILGENVEDGWGRFVEPNNFVYITNYLVNLVDWSEKQIWWKSDNPCEAYIKLRGDYWGGEGSPDRLDSDFYYIVGETVGTKMGDDYQYGVKEIPQLPVDVETYSSSMTDDWQLIMATYAL